MKRLVLLLIPVFLLCGCGKAETMETIADEMLLPVVAQPRETWVSLPEDSVLPAMESESGTIYLCEEYDVAVQTLAAGDLDATLRTVTGYGAEDLTVIQTQDGEVDKYEFVWTMAGELGQRIGRATILDDGNYHYVLCATIDAENMAEYQEVWNGMFESFHIASY